MTGKTGKMRDGEWSKRDGNGTLMKTIQNQKCCYNQIRKRKNMTISKLRFQFILLNFFLKTLMTKLTRKIQNS